jgi:hypothetical protein
MGGRSSKVGPQPDERSVDQFERNMRGLSLNTFIGSRSGELGENWLKLENAVRGYHAGAGKVWLDELRLGVDSGGDIAALLDKARRAVASDIIAIFADYLKDNSKRSLTDDEHTRIEASIIHALQAPPKLFGAHEQVIGGAWGIAKEHPIQCVALALLIVGVFFLLYFWLGGSSVTKTATTRTAGTLVGCGFSTAALVTAGIAWLVSE